MLLFFPSFWWGSFLLRGLLLWVVLRVPFSFACLPSFPSSCGWSSSFPLLLGGAALPPPPLGGVACSLLLLRGAAFLPLLLWVGLPCPPSSVGWCCVGGVAFSPSLWWRVLLFFSPPIGGVVPVTWSCLASFGWCLPSPPSLGGAPLSLFCRVVLRCLLLLWVTFWVGLFSLVFLWVVLLGLLLWVVLRFSLSFGWCCLLSPPLEEQDLRKRKEKFRREKKRLKRGLPSLPPRDSSELFFRKERKERSKKQNLSSKQRTEKDQEQKQEKEKEKEKERNKNKKQNEIKPTPRRKGPPYGEEGTNSQWVEGEFFLGGRVFKSQPCHYRISWCLSQK